MVNRYVVRYFGKNVGQAKFCDCQFPCHPRATEQHTKEVCITIFSAQSWTRCNWDNPGQNRGKRNPPECWWRGQEEQSVEHLYTKCRRWSRQRRKLVRRLSAKNISWQGWTEKKGLANLVADEKALGPLLDFLKATEVGCREGAGERGLEWEQRNNQAGEDLLNDYVKSWKAKLRREKSQNSQKQMRRDNATKEWIRASDQARG